MPTLDADRARVQDDLRGLVSGDVYCGDLFLQLYASDGSIYEIRPLGVVRPRSTRDVVACVQYAAEQSIPLHARGAGTGLAGGALGPGLVIDFSRHLRRVLRVDDQTVRVQPGVVHERLNAYLAMRGRLFGPDPATSSSTTVGSMIAVDASGSRWLRYGSVRHHVRELEIVLADGTALRVGQEPLAGQGPSAGGSRKRELVAAVAGLLAEHGQRIRNWAAAAAGDPCGYRLDDLLAEDHLHLARLLVGSEGTLALITEAVVSTDPMPAARGVVLLLFDNVQKAARAVPEILEHQPTACDLVDRRHLSLAGQLDPRLEALVPGLTEAALLVELEGRDPADVDQRLAELVAVVRDRRRSAFAARQAVDAGEVELVWSLIRRVHPGHYPLKGLARPIPVLEDMAVGPEQLPRFLVELQNLLKRHEVVATFFCHAGQGRLQVRPFLDLTHPDQVAKMRQLAEDLYDQVLRAGGTLVAGQACGLSRTRWLLRQSEVVEPLFRRVKEIFDPRNLLNPGKLVGDNLDGTDRHLRRLVAAPRPTTAAAVRPRMRDLVELQLDWDPTQVADAAGRCNGCGRCRDQTLQMRMCPVFRVLRAEESSPRAKANLIRGVLTGQIDLTQLRTEACKQIADLCVHCYMCAGECPVQVDVPRLMMEAKGAYVAANGLRVSDWLVARVDRLSALGSLVSPLANWAIGNRPARWLLEKLLGIAQGRKLPRFSSRPFLRRAARRKLTRPVRRAGNKVAYFVDVYANYHDPQLAEALVAVLEHNGVSVFVPPEQRQAGTAAVAMGALDVARKLAEPNVAILAEAVRLGYRIVATEPAAVVSLKREYPHLVADEDARLVAEQTEEACAFLWKLHAEGKLQLDFRPLSLRLGYHAPCRLKALGAGTPGQRLVGLVPGVTVQQIEQGCSGMAGTFGLRRAGYRTSLRMGRGLMARLRDDRLQAGLTECSACKMQMEQGTALPTLHPIKVLAWAYGLMPEIGNLLTSGRKELIVT